MVFLIRSEPHCTRCRFYAVAIASITVVCFLLSPAMVLADLSSTTPKDVTCRELMDGPEGNAIGSDAKYDDILITVLRTYPTLCPP